MPRQGIGPRQVYWASPLAIGRTLGSNPWRSGQAANTTTDGLFSTAIFGHWRGVPSTLRVRECSGHQIRQR